MIDADSEVFGTELWDAGWSIVVVSASEVLSMAMGGRGDLAQLLVQAFILRMTPERANVTCAWT